MMAPIVQVQANASSISPSANIGKGFVQEYLNNCRSFYSCIYCRTHLANHDELVSRSFQGNRSRAYLFNSVVNISSGPAVQRTLNTGSHAVADIFCENCGTTMGWKYEKAYVETQKYKEGKYIIELAHVVRENRHLEFDKRDVLLNNASANHNQQRQPTKMFTREPTDCCIGSSIIGGGQIGENTATVSPLSNKSRWSLPTVTSSNDEEVAAGRLILAYEEEESDRDEELMCPFYDDLCVDRSSYQSFSSWRSNQQNRLRRSLYLDSTPYDWKYSASATSKANSLSPGSPSGNVINRAQDLPSSLFYARGRGGSVSVSGSDCSPIDDYHDYDAIQQNTRLQKSSNCSNFASTSSSASSPMSVFENVEYAKSVPTSNKNHGTKHTDKTINEQDKSSQLSNEIDNETQFNFEADPLPSSSDITFTKFSQQTANSARQHDCDHNIGPPRPMTTKSTTLTNQATTTSKTPQETPTITEVKQLSSNQEIATTSCKNLISTIGIDDEEFYDCCDEHDMTNSNLIL